MSAIIDKHFTGYNSNTRIGDYIFEVSVRNKNSYNFPVLSVNNRLGFITQSEQFGDRKIASEDTSNYKIIDNNDFAYNPARINVGSIARLTNFECGIVSPMYTCFRCNDLILPEYFELFLESKYFQAEVGKRLEGSVRQCLSIEGIQAIHFDIIPLPQQIIFTEQLRSIQSQLSSEVTISLLYQNQRKYLLTNMFI